MAETSTAETRMPETHSNGSEVLETREWLDSLDYVLSQGGPERAGRSAPATLPARPPRGAESTCRSPPPRLTSTPFRRGSSRRFPAARRWSAASRAWCAGMPLAMVVRANKVQEGIGGHISTYASAATLYEVAFNHFLRARTEDGDRDVVYFQGHAAPGMYARAYLEGRIPEEKLENFRREMKPGGGLSSYPHPWLMPDFWEFPTVSMGLGPIQAIYQARFKRYLEESRPEEHPTPARSGPSWATAKPMSPNRWARLRWPSREKLDNLIFVVNCNLQRLDGPVRGNGKIIQELEAIFRGAGWNVIKVALGQRLGPAARKRIAMVCWSSGMGEIVDGQLPEILCRERQPTSGEHFFGTDPRLLEDGRAPLRRAAVAHAARRSRSAQGATPPTRRRSSTRARRPSFSPRPSRATAWAKPAKARTSPTSRRS